MTIERLFDATILRCGNPRCSALLRFHGRDVADTKLTAFAESSGWTRVAPRGVHVTAEGEQVAKLHRAVAALTTGADPAMRHLRCVRTDNGVYALDTSVAELRLHGRAFVELAFASHWTLADVEVPGGDEWACSPPCCGATVIEAERVSAATAAKGT